jgi:hypothetical protein
MTQLSDDTRYEQMCEDYRSLNGFLWQIPIIVTTLNGGLWFSVANFPFTLHAQTDLLRFATIADLLMIVVLWRVRIVLNGVQEQISKLDGRSLGKARFIVVTCFTVLLGVAALGSFTASGAPGTYFTKPAAETAKGKTDSAPALPTPPPAQPQNHLTAPPPAKPPALSAQAPKS